MQMMRSVVSISDRALNGPVPVLMLDLIPVIHEGRACLSRRLEEIKAPRISFPKPYDEKGIFFWC